MSADSPDERLLDRLRSELERSQCRSEDLLRHAMESERRVQDIQSTRTWRLAGALGAAATPQGLLALPSRLLQALKSPSSGNALPLNPAAEKWEARSDAADSRPVVLIVTAFVGVGGAERLMLDLMGSLGEEISFVLAYTEPSANDWEDRFRRVCSAIERVGDAKTLVAFAGRAGAKVVIVSSTALGYDAIPALEESGLHVFDIVHNTASIGWLRESIRQDRYIDKHFAVGGPQREALAAGGVPGSKIVLSPNGVDVEGRFRPEAYLARMEELRTRFGVDADKSVICWIGRLSSEKDPLLFVDVVARLRDSRSEAGVCALMLGDGPQRLAVEAAIREHDLTATVETLGVRDDTAEALAVSDVFVLPSRVEGSPITLLEAMSMGCAVVAADVGAVSEVVDDGRNGRVLRDRSAASFAATIANLLDHPELRRSLGAAARATVAERFNAVDSAAIYRGVLLRALQAEV